MSVCNDQTTFNKAVKIAADDYLGTTKTSNTFMVVSIIIYLILLIWAVMIAMQVSSREDRTLHIFFAIMAPPAYIISHFL